MSGIKHLFAATVALALAAAPALASEATFERSLTVNGRVELSIATGSGNIRLTHGSGSQVHIFGRVSSGRGGSDEQVKQIAANPPIDQTGNIIRIGARHQTLHNISIDYEIEAPANAYLNAGTGSGNVDDDGVGESAKLNTGSGIFTPQGCTEAFRWRPVQATSTPIRPGRAMWRPIPVLAASNCATLAAASRLRPEWVTSN